MINADIHAADITQDRKTMTALHVNCGGKAAIHAVALSRLGVHSKMVSSIRGESEGGDSELRLRGDPDVAYDWTRFPYVTEWGGYVIERLRAFDLSAGGAHFLDSMCGSGWLPLMVAAEFPHCRVVCSDISEAAAALCEENAKQNRLENCSVHVGDLFSATSGLPTWPRFAFLYPPQIEGNPDVDGCGSPGVSLFVPDVHLMFRRIADELPQLYPRGAVSYLWLGVDWDLVAERAFLSLDISEHADGERRGPPI